MTATATATGAQAMSEMRTIIVLLSIIAGWIIGTTIGNAF